MQIKQYLTVAYLGFALDENLFGETMTLKVISKINCREKIDFCHDVFVDYCTTL